MRNWSLVLCAFALTVVGCGDDGGVVDTDSGVRTDASTMTDASTTEDDASTTDDDASTSDDDAGTMDDDAGMMMADAGSDAGGEPAPTFAELRAGLASCMSCHSGPGRAGFTLSGGAAAVYAELVTEERTHASCETLDRRVVPNEPSMSVLYLRTHGTTCGDRMPASPTQQALIEDWINAGAPGPL